MLLRSLLWKPYSRLIIVGDNARWAIDEETKQLEATARALGIKTIKAGGRMRWNIPQAVHFSSQFSLLHGATERKRNRISLDYFHGKLEHGENYKKCLEIIGSNPENLSRVRVSTKEMERLIKATGIDPEKVRRIPIGIDLPLFPPQTAERRAAAREKYGIPEEAFVVGSFQKDGVGWGEGLEPKLIKGPDVFLKVVEKLRSDIPHLFVLLSGPSRGFVKKGLEELGIPYRHEYLEEYRDVSALYDALDLYLVASREEGGPKACLESMAKGVPLVTTAVGQCADLVINGENAMMAAVDDSESLVLLSMQVCKNPELRERITSNGFKTAKEHSVEAQAPLWKEYFSGLVNHEDQH